MRISDWSSDVCSSDLLASYQTMANLEDDFRVFLARGSHRTMMVLDEAHYIKSADGRQANSALRLAPHARGRVILTGTPAPNGYEDLANLFRFLYPTRSEEHTSELQSLMRISYAVFCLK